MVREEEDELEERLKKLEKKYKENIFKSVGETLLELPSQIYEAIKPAVKPSKKETEKPLRKNRFYESKIENEEIEEDESWKKEVEEDNRSEDFIKKEIPPRKVLKNVYRGERPSSLEIKKCAEDIKKLKDEIARVIVGQDEIIDGLIMGLLCNSHVLLEGVPGIAKTLAIRALGAASGCDVKRIQFTVDMLPTDIIGLTIYTPQKGFEVVKGPVFANFIIADEINRAPPKTQSALIEAMQEKQVTIGKERFPLPSPFFVMATENPIENAGVYPLPEAQIDRFLFKIIMGYPKRDVEKEIMVLNGELHSDEQELLIEKGSQPKNLWGINIYPEIKDENWIEFDSVINLKPHFGNRTRGVEDPEIKEKIIKIINKLIER